MRGRGQTQKQGPPRTDRLSAGDVLLGLSGIDRVLARIKAQKQFNEAQGRLQGLQTEAAQTGGFVSQEVPTAETVIGPGMSLDESVNIPQGRQVPVAQDPRTQQALIDMNAARGTLAEAALARQPAGATAEGDLVANQLGQTFTQPRAPGQPQLMQIPIELEGGRLANQNFWNGQPVGAPVPIGNVRIETKNIGGGQAQKFMVDSRTGTELQPFGEPFAAKDGGGGGGGANRNLAPQLDKAFTNFARVALGEIGGDFKELGDISQYISQNILTKQMEINQDLLLANLSGDPEFKEEFLKAMEEIVADINANPNKAGQGLAAGRRFQKTVKKIKEARKLEDKAAKLRTGQRGASGLSPEAQDIISGF
jgi:hypothetical protein